MTSILTATLAQIGKPSFWGESYNHKWSRKEQKNHDQAREGRIYTIMKALGRPMTKAEIAEMSGLTSSVLQRTLWGLRDKGMAEKLNAHAPRNIRWVAK